MAKTKKPRPKRMKQARIPGTEPVSIPEIDSAAEQYRDQRDERMALQKDETTYHDALLRLMQEHGLQSYEYDGFTVHCLSSTKVKVKRKKDGENGEENGEE